MPPRPVSIALYREGNSDDYFLPPLIRRTTEQLVGSRARYDIDIQDIMVVNERERIVGPYNQRVIRAAEIAYGYDILVLHQDADNRLPDQALRDFAEARDHVHACQQPVCVHLAPLIPIKMIEAWILADADAVLAVTKSHVAKSNLGLPDQPHQVEAIEQPKLALKKAINIAHGKRKRNQLSTKLLFTELAEIIDLDVLVKVPSYHRFKTDLEQMFIDLHLIA
jgi:hypothetical protein